MRVGVRSKRCCRLGCRGESAAPPVSHECSVANTCPKVMLIRPLVLLLLLAAAAPAGVDLDYEPTNSDCQVKTTGVTCTTDAESVAVTTALRNVLPQGRYLLSTASWHVGCYGEGAFKASQPASIYTGA